MTHTTTSLALEPSVWKCRNGHGTFIRDTAGRYMGRVQCPICLHHGVVGQLEAVAHSYVRGGTPR